ncbi:MAG TPA: haloacid dehalogenase type II [Steroidobacteraceae bacterium]|jgi:2-haloacid dehalogenase
MRIDRRTFLAASVASVLGARATAGDDNRQARKPIKAILFDAFPLFDPRVVVALAERLYPEKAATLVAAWRARQFEYQWLRALGDRYVDFLEATTESLTYAAHQSGLSLTEENRVKLMSAYTELHAWPDTQEILPKLRELGISLGILSNMTIGPLESGLTRGNLRTLFSHVLSTDSVRSFKPSRRAYQLGIDCLGLDREEVLFVAFAGWDVAGAVWFGYPTYWLNRLGSVPEELSASPWGTGTDLRSLLGFLEAKMLRS